MRRAQACNLSLLRRSRSLSSASPAIAEQPQQLRDVTAQLVPWDDGVEMAEAEVRSDRPKSSGSFSRVVCCTTRGPAKDMSAPGSAISTSPRLAKLASGRRWSGGRARDERDAGVVEILDRRDGLRKLHQREDPLLHPSAARSGHRDERAPRSIALSHARENFSPTTLPIEPPMNAKSMTASSNGAPRSPPDRSPSRRRARVQLRLREPLRVRARSKNASGSSERRSAASSTKVRRRRAARSACGPARRSGVRTVRRRRATPRARRPGSANRISGTCSGAASLRRTAARPSARSRRRCGWHEASRQSAYAGRGVAFRELIERVGEPGEVRLLARRRRLEPLSEPIDPDGWDPERRRGNDVVEVRRRDVHVRQPTRRAPRTRASGRAPACRSRSRTRRSRARKPRRWPPSTRR